VSTRPAHLRKTLKTNHEDMEAARTLHAAVKKTKIRRRVRPIQERRWFQAAVLVGVLAVIAGVVGVFWYATRPPSAESLFQKAQTLMAFNDVDSWKKARDEPIKKYLEYYGNTQTEHTTQVRQWADKVDGRVREMQLRNRMKMKLAADDDTEKTARNAVTQEEIGDWPAALARWGELLKLKEDSNADAHAWGLLAEKRIQYLDGLAQDQRRLVERVNQAREQREEPKVGSPTEQQAILSTRYEQFGDASAALKAWEDLKNSLPEGDDHWRLLAAHEIHDLTEKVPSAADAKPTRLKLLAQHLAKAQSTTSYNAVESFAECRDIIDLYGHESDPDVKKQVETARKLLAQRAKELSRDSTAGKH
jgi:hypothetical protein